MDLGNHSSLAGLTGVTQRVSAAAAIAGSGIGRIEGVLTAVTSQGCCAYTQNPVRGSSGSPAAATTMTTGTAVATPTSRPHDTGQ